MNALTPRPPTQEQFNQLIQKARGSSSRHLVKQLLLAADRQDLSITDSKNRSLLHIATKINHLEIVTDLLSLGVARGVQDFCGNTPLHYARYNASDAIFDVLLQNGVPSQIVNKRGLSAYDLLPGINHWANYVVHVNGLKGLGGDELSGGYADYIIKNTAPLLAQSQSLLSFEVQQELVDSLCTNLLEAKKRIHQRSLAIFPLKSKDHVFYVALYKNRLAICDRARETDDEVYSPALVFEIDPRLLRPPYISDLLDELVQNQNKEDIFEMAYVGLPHWLDGSSDFEASHAYRVIGRFKGQEAPNCTYANLKAAIRLGAAFLLEERKEPDWAKKALAFSKNLSTNLRLESLEHLLTEAQHTPHSQRLLLLLLAESLLKVSKREDAKDINWNRYPELSKILSYWKSLSVPAESLPTK